MGKEKIVNKRHLKMEIVALYRFALELSPLLTRKK
jgi:hypothetical protein